MARKRPEELRSHRWIGVNDLRSFGHRSRLRQGGFLTRDPRAKERKKYGQKGARKRFQFSKR